MVASSYHEGNRVFCIKRAFWCKAEESDSSLDGVSFTDYGEAAASGSSFGGDNDLIFSLDHRGAVSGGHGRGLDQRSPGRISRAFLKRQPHIMLR